MSDRHETIADIIAEMRQGMNPNGTAECQYLESDICMLADRLEAALKRELSKNTSKNGADFGQLGDCAKLREALIKAITMLAVCEWPDGTNIEGVEELRRDIDAALDVPPRNCDVGTPEEQKERMHQFCLKNGAEPVGGGYMCEKCPLLHEDRCELAWAQMPYEEGGGK